MPLGTQNRWGALPDNRRKLAVSKTQPTIYVELLLKVVDNTYPPEAHGSRGVIGGSGGYTERVMNRPRRSRGRDSDILRAVMALVGFIVLPILLVTAAVLFTAALLGGLVNV